MKRILSELLRLAAHFVSFFLLPLVLLISFNYTKGIANNEDGIFFIPFGILFLLSLIILNAFLMIRGWQRYTNRKYLFWLSLGAVAALALCLTFPLWEDFFSCFAFYKGFNLGKQIYR